MDARRQIFFLRNCPPHRRFHPLEYEAHRSLDGMPQDIPAITPFHYLVLITPIVLLVVVYIHHREQVRKNLEEERDRARNIQVLLLIGTFLAGLFIGIHLRVVPSESVRLFFPGFKQPAPMHPVMKLLLLSCFAVFIVYPTLKYLYIKRRMRSRSLPGPEVHRIRMLS